MTRFGLAFAMLFILAEGECFKDCGPDCGIDEKSGTAVIQSPEVFQYFEVYTRACTTCGHSKIVVTGTYPPNTDKLALARLVYICGQSGLYTQIVDGIRVDTKNLERVNGGAGFRAEWTEVNVKFPCGEKVSVHYSVFVSNPSNAPLTVNASITCPQKLGSDSSPTGPGSVRNRRSPLDRLALNFANPRELAMAMAFR